MKEREIYEDINQLFVSIIKKKDNGDLKMFFDFLKRNPQHAPFNNALIFAQRPKCVYYMSARQWKEKFDKTIKIKARPMVTLFPFGPVNFVYDYNDTEGGAHTDKNSLIEWWKEKKSNRLSTKVFERTIKHINKKYQILHISKESDEYFKKLSLSIGGYACKEIKTNKFEITLHPRYKNITESNIAEAYGILVHEIAHIFLGHLGEKTYIQKQKNKSIRRKLYGNRSYISQSVSELEAELTAWVVFSRFGIEKESVDYMAIWLEDQNDWQEIDISRVLKVANTIFEMRK